jgi:uncharacterized protein (TIGR03000 family)
MTRFVFGVVLAGLLAPVAVAQPRLSRGPWIDRPALTGPGPGWRDRQALANAVTAPWQYHDLPSGPRTTLGVGVGVWPGLWGFGGWPAAGGGFWTNGLSLYGPPIPTYGPVPGTFGGSDAHRFYSDPPLFGFGLNYLGYRSPSPRLANPTVSVYPPGQEPPPRGRLLPAPTNARCARVEVTLPHPDADVWLNGTAVRGSGATRGFESPELEAGKTYQYEVVARWQQDGRERAESRTVTVAAGQTAVADFTQGK